MIIKHKFKFLVNNLKNTLKMLAQTLSLTAVIIVGVVGQQFQDPNQQQFNQQPPQQVRHDLILLSFLKKHYRQTDQNHTNATKFDCV